MDTTLMTFHLQTSSSTQSIHLIGSWDNFMKHYPMERDIKRASGQWRGCYRFEDIICDGDGDTSPKRTGGLKMGSTYYYYYELDDGTEIHDPSLPFTTACPYLPGQPVNLLTVPVEVQPLRLRSASMNSMAVENVKTMEPSDKFMSPRPPPAPPVLKRLKTSPSVLLRKRTARSVSPKPPKSPWSPKAFFGSLRSPSPYSQEGDSRGRSQSSLTKTIDSDRVIDSELNITRPAMRTRSHSENQRGLRSVPHTRDASPQSFKRTRSREPSPLRQFIAQDATLYNSHSLTLIIPDEIEEEDAENDDNFASEFASQVTRKSQYDRGILTPLAPPPAGLRFPMSPFTSGASTPRDTSKPLPMLPDQLHISLVSALAPPPLRIRSPVPEADLPRSHFSTSTVSTSWTSPTDSHFGFSETPSIADDEEELTPDVGSGDESAYSPVKDINDRFNNYSLPEAEYESLQSLHKEPIISTLTQAASRTTFGGAAAFVPNVDDVKNMNALEQLMAEMGYLGHSITGK